MGKGEIVVITDEQLRELIGEAEQAKGNAQREVLQWTQRAEEAEQEELAYRKTLSRRHPELFSAEARYDFQPRSNWPQMARTRAVLNAVAELTVNGEDATPAGIESFLATNGRTDTRDQIGGALAHLNRQDEVHSVGRARWQVGPDPSKTPGDDVDASSPGTVPTERAGGDDHAAPPANPLDRDPTYGRRNDRDHNRLADDPVTPTF